MHPPRRLGRPVVRGQAGAMVSDKIHHCFCAGPRARGDKSRRLSSEDDPAPAVRAPATSCIRGLRGGANSAQNKDIFAPTAPGRNYYNVSKMDADTGRPYRRYAIYPLTLLKEAALAVGRQALRCS